ncbi:MAG: isocitrate lyase/PEP mutase family protein [Rhodospirillaceae bacterium]|nr:isocitrate lyase/PEP mutase family protein [Rhodospirillaceae bacterium]MBT7770716.1 isocitrate lyase/PEP mutase family protein [Rhodospirillales bacterium]MBT4702563.1 isocitrate lyase/PEP mutase family protein [Rhodospirillaceae bacterium]MBT5033739.1 isocitrate lyase/PEP mutase family protein [Rhodospirillaceae bacterium]MBT6221919.1 isocitrate lyase/PEP mutase family protein [Rhodospirillaceae bacterium]
MTKTDQLRAILAEPGAEVMPGVFDAMSARLVERAGFRASFMSGFAVAAARLAMPDTGLISYTEMANQGQNMCDAVSMPIIGDGDTGYGNAINVRRTVEGFARAGFACVMIEDQVSPKRCGHTRGKKTVDRAEAFARIKAAIDVKNDGTDILIMARTDANATEGFNEALYRAKKFAELGADITFLEAPKDVEQMRTYCEQVPGPKMANMVEQGDTPVLSPKELGDIGYKIVVHPLTLLMAGIKAMEDVLTQFKNGTYSEDSYDFSHLRDVVGFPEYYEAEKKYATE